MISQEVLTMGSVLIKRGKSTMRRGEVMPEEAHQRAGAGRG
jgi:hypothetical protein